jgi:hypothetical protein
MLSISSHTYRASPLLLIRWWFVCCSLCQNSLTAKKNIEQDLRFCLNFSKVPACNSYQDTATTLLQNDVSGSGDKTCAEILPGEEHSVPSSDKQSRGVPGHAFRRTGGRWPHCKRWSVPPGAAILGNRAGVPCCIDKEDRTVVKLAHGAKGTTTARKASVEVAN